MDRGYYIDENGQLRDRYGNVVDTGTAADASTPAPQSHDAGPEALAKEQAFYDEVNAKPTASASPPPSTGSRGSGSGYSYSYSGTPASARQLQDDNLAGDFARVDANTAQEFKRLAGPQTETNRRQQQGIISDEDMANAPTSYEAEQAKLKATQRAQQYQADLQAQMLEDEKVASEHSKSLVAHARAQYAAQVMAYQSMQVNPGQLWHNMSGGMKVETLAAVFAHNFLAAKGIQTTAMDTINAAIDQNINAQIENIRKQGQVVDHFGQLYNMVSAESATDEEARVRLRGLMLAQAENMTNAYLLKFDAPIAQAKAVETRMAFQSAQDQNMLALDDHLHARAEQAKQDYLEWRKALLSASMESRRISEQTREFDEANKPKPVDYGSAASKARESVYFDIDPTSPTFGKPQGMILEGTSPADRTKIRDIGAKAMSVMQEVKALRDGTAKMTATYGGKWASQALTTQDQKRVRALQARLALMLAAEENRGRPSDKDQEAAEQYVPLKTLTTYGDVDQVVNDLLLLTKQEYNNSTAGQVRNFTVDPGTGLPEDALLSGTTALVPAEGDTYKTEGNTWGAPEVPDAVQEDMTNAQMPRNEASTQSHLDDLKTMVNDAETAKANGDATAVQKAYDFISDTMYDAADQDDPDGYLEAWGGVDELGKLQTQLIKLGAHRPDDTETVLRNLRRKKEARTPKKDDAVKFDQSPDLSPTGD
jgi:hypothetical protein